MINGLHSNVATDRDRQTDRQIDRKTDRQTDRQTDRRCSSTMKVKAVQLVGSGDKYR